MQCGHGHTISFSEYVSTLRPTSHCSRFCITRACLLTTRWMQIDRKPSKAGDASGSAELTEDLEEADRRSEVAKKQFSKFRDVCISAQQVKISSPHSTSQNLWNNEALRHKLSQFLLQNLSSSHRQTLGTCHACMALPETQGIARV